MAAAAARCAETNTIDTVIFDVDDTLYPASSGFSAHRNGPVAGRFMVERLGFATMREALDVRNEYFRKYHSTLKGLAVATREGRLPKPFVESELGDYWADHCDFESFLTPNATFAADLRALLGRTSASNRLKLVVFTNAPRKYGLECLRALGLDESLFECIVGVEDVMPHCKPEPEAFETVLRMCGSSPERCVMVEDSMKNVRACKALGMRTVLVDERLGTTTLDDATGGSEATLLGDVAKVDDPAVDVAVPSVTHLRAALPGLWDAVPHFGGPPQSGGAAS